jgi:hypothetical protein
MVGKIISRERREVKVVVVGMGVWWDRGGEEKKRY